MYNKEEIWQAVEQLLFEEDDILVPLYKLLYLLKMERAVWQDLTEKELKDILSERKIFIIYEFPEEKDLWPDKDNEEMAEKGFYKGDKVMLLDKKPSAEDLRQMLLGNLDYLYRNLQEISQKPENIEDEKLETYMKAMERTKELYEKFSNLILDDYEE